MENHEVITFTDTPPSHARTSINLEHAQELIDACIDNYDQWACVPIDWLYPDYAGKTEGKKANKAKYAAGNIAQGRGRPFDQYTFDAKARGTNLYLKIRMSQRELRNLERHP